MKTGEKNGKRDTDLMELLTALEYQTIELAAIRQAATDYVSLRNIAVFPNQDALEKHQQEINLAYLNLEQLVSPIADIVERLDNGEIKKYKARIIK